ncbi:DNA-binding transcriptional regulator OxyR [Neptunicella sp. SCSIO 80796]|uniref:DNA-binding transcriptional regulator OxyR n=1 Tax=Neptunicella plasticusilytica TaxID=3117012 RepID=UPI003A4DD226
MIKLRELEYLDAIVRYKHFGKAAEACHVSQPTLSGQLMKLEEQLGLQLIERHRRNVMLTPAGETLIKDARNVLKAAKTFEESARALLDPLAGDMHIGLIPTLAPYLLPLIVENLNSQLPRINFYLHENKTEVLLQELNSGKLDLLVLPWLDEMEKFERYDLFEEPLLLAVHPSHPLAECKQVNISVLEGQKILTLEDGHCLRDQAMDYCFTAGANEDHRFQATSLETLRHMVASNRGITLLPKLATLNVTATSNIRYIPFKEPQPVRNISLVIRPNYSRMDSIRAIATSIRNSVKQAV